MKKPLRVTLSTSPEQAQGLMALQKAFAQVCNALAPLVQQSRCWNRVTLHHLAYKSLREQFPQIGSQMVCNAIYSVSLTARIVFQHPASPFHLSRLQGKPLPLLRFLDTSPVYFDRHTLSVKSGTLSMYTLDGRMRFMLSLSAADEKNFHEKKLREIVLSQQPKGTFELLFWFTEPQDEEAGARAPGAQRPDTRIPDYVKVEAAA
jgi:hypothetical protein